MDSSPVVLPIALTANQVRPVAYRVVSKKHGLNLKSSALDVLAGFLGRRFGTRWRDPDAEKFLDAICRQWKEDGRGIFVDGEPLLAVIKDLTSADSAQGQPDKFDVNDYFRLIDARTQKPLVYSSQQKTFVLPPSNDQAAVHMFARRYHMLLDKLYRNELFQPAGLGAGDDGYSIVSIKNMLGRPLGASFFLFGQLEKQTDGPWTLYDTSASIALTFSALTQFAPDHYFPSGSFALCYGTYNGDTFLVGTLGPPQPEPRSQAQIAYDRIDFLGTPGARIERVDTGLAAVFQRESARRATERIAVLGCDIFLDDARSVDALHRCLGRLASDPPRALVIPGSFLSRSYRPHIVDVAQVYRECMNSLADALAEFPSLSQTKVVLVPGAHDPWHACAQSVLPYAPLPSVFTGRVERASADVHLASNPTRLQYLEHELLLFRCDAGELLRRHSVNTAQYADDPNNNAEMMDERPVAHETAALESLALDTDAGDRAEERGAEQAAARVLASSSVGPPQGHGRTALNDTREARRVFATLLDQAHLAPFAPRVQSVAAEQDHVLSMAQWPTALVLMDPTTPAIWQQYEGCTVLNPGAFLLHDRANWLEYYPNTSACEFCSA